MWYINYYQHCDNEWEEEWDSIVKDPCPYCGKEVLPIKSKKVCLFCGSFNIDKNGICKKCDESAIEFQPEENEEPEELEEIA